jgi:Flp pilus assembly protein TadG
VRCPRVRGIRSRVVSALADDRGSSPVEFVLVGTLLTLLTLGVLQFGLTVYVRNVVHDAAVEGAHHAALADTSLADGVERTREIVSRTVGAGYAAEIGVDETTALGHPAVRIDVRATLPLVGLLGVPRLMEVTAHAPVESFD